jgi:thiamine-monophosphate kinase
MPTSEQEFLRVIDRHFPNAGPGLLLGRGDDCAVLDPAGRFCISTDAFVEDVHFRRAYFSPADIGHKALAAAASDLAGMAAHPLGFALSLILPDDVDDAFLDAMLGGMARLASALGLPLVGGDLSRGPKLALDVVVLGTPGPRGRLLKRCAAKPGDALLLAGDIGLARAGLLLLEQSGCKGARAWPAALDAHLRPHPRIDEALALAELATAEGPAVTGLMDVSDGLARDLPRFLGPYGANITLGREDLNIEVTAFFTARGEDPMEAALLGGEDYALIASATEKGAAAVLAELPLVRAIGKVTMEPGVRLNSGQVLRQGFDHFAKPQAG